MNEPPTIRPLAPGEWQIWKGLRLAALAGTPDAFGPTLAEAQTRTDADWQRSGERFTEPGRRLFIALRGETPCGLVSAVLGEDGAGHLGAMWVAPAERGSGLGARLFDTACSWLSEAGARRLELTVTDGNHHAERLYARRGFVRSGVEEPLRDGSPLRNVQMVKRLAM